MSQETRNVIFLITNKDHIILISIKNSYNKPCVRTKVPFWTLNLNVNWTMCKLLASIFANKEKQCKLVF